MTLADVAQRWNAWLLDAALPLWWNEGADKNGGFEELLGLDGKPVRADRRARVQGRQSYVYALAGSMGWKGPWREGARHGIAYLKARYGSMDSGFATLCSPDGKIVDPAIKLYDQAFALLALANMHKMGIDSMADATALLGFLETRRHPKGGFREAGGKPFLSNPHMHLLEAALAWEEVAPEGPWSALADEIVELCLSRFVRYNVLFETFTETWSVASTDVEPGHQFEWAWLLKRWASLRQSKDTDDVAAQLFAAGKRGIDPKRDVAVDKTTDAFKNLDTPARLWPQTERMKAALLFAQSASDRERYIAEALAAAAALERYLGTPVKGVWRDKLLGDNMFVEEPAPGSTFYHIACCIQVLNETVAKIG